MRGGNTEDDKGNLPTTLISPGPELNSQMTWRLEQHCSRLFKVAQALVSSPDEYANRQSFATNPDPKFKTSKNLNDLILLLHQPKNIPAQEDNSPFANAQQLLCSFHTGDIIRNSGSHATTASQSSKHPAKP